MNSIESAYQSIGEILFKAALRKAPWKYLQINAPILGKNLGGTISIEKQEGGGDVDIPLGMSIFDIQDAVLYLRDDLLKTTGQRIWGLTFTLYPDGKFNIEYDYNKPEGYEETDETISGNEINASLGKLAGKSSQ